MPSRAWLVTISQWGIFLFWLHITVGNVFILTSILRKHWQITIQLTVVMFYLVGGHLKLDGILGLHYIQFLSIQMDTKVVLLIIF